MEWRRWAPAVDKDGIVGGGVAEQAAAVADAPSPAVAVAEVVAGNKNIGRERYSMLRCRPLLSQR